MNNDVIQTLQTQLMNIPTDYEQLSSFVVPPELDSIIDAVAKKGAPEIKALSWTLVSRLFRVKIFQVRRITFPFPFHILHYVFFFFYYLTSFPSAFRVLLYVKRVYWSSNRDIRK